MSPIRVRSNTSPPSYPANGVVTAAEYDRDLFERLDRDGDGVLTPADYADGEAMDRRMTTMEAQRMVAEYLQDDEDPAEVAVWEVFAAAEAYDADRDELLEEEEFRALAAEHLSTALPHVATQHYEGSHWLASFAVYALTRNR